LVNETTDKETGLGAGHETGWTGILARVLDLFARLSPEDVLRKPKAAIGRVTREHVAGE